MDVMKLRVTTQYAQDRARCFNGGDYDYGYTELRDYWTGVLVAEWEWTSADFPFCPLGHGFSCSCAQWDGHGALWDTVDACDVLCTYDAEELEALVTTSLE